MNEFDVEGIEYTIVPPPTQDPHWKCYMYGSDPSSPYGSMIYRPSRGQVPNWLGRWGMRVFLGCTWVYTEGETD